MNKRRFNPTLPIAFALAVALHAAVLPLVLLGGELKSRVPQTDMRLIAVDGPAYAQAGDNLVLDVTLGYTGPRALKSAIHYRVWLSRDRLIDADDIQVGRAGWFHLLDAGSDGHNESRHPLTMDVQLPVDADGPYQLIAEVDSAHFINDANPANNTRATPIYINGPLRPELQVTAANLPPQAILGGTSLFSYTTTNRGQGWANYLPASTDIRAGQTSGGWRDAVYLSTDTTLDERDLPLRTFHRRSPLGPGEDYAHNRVALDLPRVPAGTYHLILVADVDQVLDQPSFTAGVYTQQIEMVDTNLPDLAIASIASPGSVVLGEPFAVQWEAANLGSVATDVSGSGTRQDAVYLSRDDTLDPSDTQLTSHRIDTPLAAQARQTHRAASITIPHEPQFAPDATGENFRGWYLIVVADDTDAIDEGPFEDNNAFAVPITLLAPRDDAEPELGEPDNAPKLTVAWIEYERVEEHMARLTQTIQPAIQNLVDPDPNAPLVLDPKPPAPPAIALQPGGAPRDPAQPFDPDRTDSRPQPPVPDAPDTNTAPNTSNNTPQAVPERSDGADQTPINPTDRAAESDSNTDTDSETDSQTPAERDRPTDATQPNDNDSDQSSEVMDDSAGETPNDNEPAEEPTETDGEADHDDEMDEQTATPDPAEQDSDQPEGEPNEPSNPSEEQETTRAPRDDAEADPADTTPDRLRLEEGNVLVGRGVRVNTSRIRRGSTSSRLTAIPRDTDVRVVFDNQGRVVEAEVLGDGTGYADWDARLLEALYRWTAQGPDIEAADPHYVLRLEYQFGLLNRRE